MFKKDTHANKHTGVCVLIMKISGFLEHPCCFFLQAFLLIPWFSLTCLPSSVIFFFMKIERDVHNNEGEELIR